MTTVTGAVPHAVCITTAARLAAKINELADGFSTATVVVRKDDYKRLCEEMPHQTAGAFTHQVSVRLEKLLQPIKVESVTASPRQDCDFTIACTVKG